MDDSCIFCRIIRGEIPSERVLEDDETVAIRDIDPVAPVHVLVLPRQHVRSLNDLAQLEAGQAERLLQFVVKVAAATGVSETGYRLITNSGPDAGQEVDHLHLHVIGGRRLGTLA